MQEESATHGEMVGLVLMCTMKTVHFVLLFSTDPHSVA